MKARRAGPSEPKLPTASEHAEQSCVASWLRAQHPRVLFFAIPNGAHLAGNGQVRAMKMAKLKAEGLLPGTSDLFIACPSGPWSGLFVEMKAVGGAAATPNQKDFGARAIAAGYQWAVCRGAREAITAINDYIRQL